MRLNDNPSVNEILRYIFENAKIQKDTQESEFTYIILGRPGRTGKTWLCTALRQSGFKAFEISDSVAFLVSYCDFENYYLVDSLSKTVTIILNKRL